jgi:hypothetical protein
MVEELNCRAEEDVEGKGLSHLYESLNNSLRKLKRLELMSHWFSAAGGITKLEKELVPIQQELGRIDNLRVDGRFMDEGRTPPGQAVLHFLLHKCYRITNKLQAKAEGAGMPVDQELVPIYNNLVTLHACLAQLVKYKIVLGAGESLPYRMKLSAIEEKRTDGKVWVCWC